MKTLLEVSSTATNQTERAEEFLQKCLDQAKNPRPFSDLVQRSNAHYLDGWQQGMVKRLEEFASDFKQAESLWESKQQKLLQQSRELAMERKSLTKKKEMVEQ